jgi:hypothetical protein
VVPVRKFLESPIDAKFVRVYGAGVLGKLRIDCMSCAYREQNVEPIDFHFRAMLILAVSLPRMTEKAAKCALRRRTIALVMAGCLAFCANVVWAFVTAAGLVAKIVARRTYRDVGMLIIVIFLVITAVIVLIASKPLTEHSILRIVSQHNTRIIFAFVFHVRCAGSMFTSCIRCIVVVIILVLTSV